MQTGTEPARPASPTHGNRGRRLSAPPKGADHPATEANPRRVEIEHEIAQARPRLLRLARAHGLPLDAAHEVVQGTLLEAWRHLDALSDPAGFQLWPRSRCLASRTDEI
jgi:hypothetical protein